MSIRIDAISVQGLGPIGEARFEFGDFNLIYGKNEQGKTYLIEFILRSLFRSSADWALRRSIGKGEIAVSGLAGAAPHFSPNSKAKLDDFIDKETAALTSSLARLLVVKGAELSLAGAQPGGINRTVLKEYLSSQYVLDEISQRISSTLQHDNTALANGAIEGNHQGEIKKQRQIKEELEKVDQFFERLQTSFAGGERAALAEKRKALIDRLGLLDQARRHQAFQLSQNIIELHSSGSGISRETIHQLRSLNQARALAARTIEKYQEQQAKLAHESTNYRWLEDVLPDYRLLLARGIGKKATWQLVSGLAASGTAAVAFALRALAKFPAWLDYVGLAGMVLSLVFFLLYSRREIQDSTALDAQDRRSLEEEYQARFGMKMGGLTSLDAQLKTLSEAHVQNVQLSQLIDDQRKELEKSAIELRQRLAGLEADAEDPDQCAAAINALEDKLQKDGAAIQQAEVALASLGVEPQDYVEEDPGISYNKPDLESLDRERENVIDELTALDRKTEELKNQLMGELGTADPSLSLEGLVEKLQEKRTQIARQYRQATSEIIAKVLVRDELRLIKEREDQEIARSLQSATITDPLFAITRKYKSLDLVDGQIEISDGRERFPISELSTGAREQVLLALRIGFASRLLGADKLFLILDDAFQHADWDRRGYLLDEIVALAKSGWQCIYLTMDDHIRDSFCKAGKQAFGDGFRYYCLGSTD